MRLRVGAERTLLRLSRVSNSGLGGRSFTRAFVHLTIEKRTRLKYAARESRLPFQAAFLLSRLGYLPAVIRDVHGAIPADLYTARFHGRKRKWPLNNEKHPTTWVYLVALAGAQY